MNTTENPPVERLLIPDMALTAAEYFAVNNNEKVLVLLTDMTSYADALAIVSNRCLLYTSSSRRWYCVTVGE